MKAAISILLGLILSNSSFARSIPIYDFNSDDIRRSHEVRRALGTNRFSVNRMNQFANSAHFAAISHQCVALVTAKYDRFHPRPPHPRPPYPWPPHRPPFPGDVENGPEPAQSPIEYNNEQSNSGVSSREVNAINPNLYYDHYPNQRLRIFVSQVACHSNRGARPIPMNRPSFIDDDNNHSENDSGVSVDLN